MNQKRSIFYCSLFIVLLFHFPAASSKNIINHNPITITKDTLNKKLYDLIYRCHSFNMNEEFLVQVEKLIKQGANPNASLKLTKSEYKLGARLFGQYFRDKYTLHTFYSSPFQAAVLKKNVSLVQKMIDLGAKANIADKKGIYPIELAMSNKDEPMIFCLLKNGVDIKKFSIAYSLEDHVIKKLLKMGANPNIASKKGQYIINSHIFSDSHSSMAFLLIKHGADVNTIDLSKCYSVELTEQLVKMGANPKTIDISKAGLKSKESLKRILALKPDINSQKISFSDLFKKPELLEIMLDYGMSTNVKSDIGDYPLIFGAVKYSDIETVNKLVNKGAKLTTVHRSKTLLFHAVTNSRSDMVSFLLKKGANPNNGKGSFNQSILHEAAEKGNADIINKLIDARANIESNSWRGMTPLMTAVQKGNYLSVQTLIKRGANVNYKTPQGETALIYAIKLIGGFNKYKSAIIKFLIKSGAKTNIKYKGQTLIEFARANDATTEIIHYLKLPEENPNNINKKQEIKLEKKDSVYVQYLLSIKPDQKISENDFKFIFKNHIILDVLLNSNFNVNIKGGYKSWPFIFGAIKYGDTLAVNKILSKGVKLSFRDKSSYFTPLLFAVDEDKYEITRFLLNKGANANDEGHFEQSAIILAVRNENERIINLLIDAGADINKLGSSETPLMQAVSKKNIKIAEFLIKKGANVNDGDWNGESSLFIAIYEEVLPIIKLLIENGADTEKTYWKKTPLEYAISKKAPAEIIEYLKQVQK